MRRRTYLIALAGCLSGISGCSGGGGSGDSGPQATEGEYIDSESDPNIAVKEHTFRNTERTTLPWAVTGVVTHTTSQRETIQVSVNFLDGDDVVVADNYDLLTDIRGNQPAEFAVRYPGDEPGRVTNYELVVTIA